VNAEDVAGELARRAPGQWELYRKTAESREWETAAGATRVSWNREEGWAARWWREGGPRFAAASSAARLVPAIQTADTTAMSDTPAPEWPSRNVPARAAEDPLPEPATELFADLSRAIAAASRAEASLASLAVRSGRASERLVNAAGLDVSQELRLVDGLARCVARRGARARETRIPFRWDAAPDLDALARRLADAATLPLSDRPAPISSGQWLLDPAVGAALLSSLTPLFVTDRPPRWLVRGALLPPAFAIVDDASRDAAYDGEGVPTRRTVLVEDGAVAGRLLDLMGARRTGHRSTGHGVRPSYRLPPRAAPRRLFFEAADAVAPSELLPSVTRGLFAAALTAPPRVDVDADRYEIEFTGISIAAGRATGPVAGARSSGRLSELLRRIRRASTDLQFFPMPYPCGSPTLLIERASFD